MAVTDVQTGGFGSISYSDPSGPDEIFDTDNSFWAWFSVLSNWNVRLFDSYTFDSPFFTVHNNVLQLWFGGIQLRLSFYPFFFLFSFQAFRFKQGGSSIFEKRWVLINPLFFFAESCNIRIHIFFRSLNLIGFRIDNQWASRNYTASCLDSDQLAFKLNR